ncbi:hypothetical protein HK102_000754, partial [Quaeritorhiza haematococci]
MRFKNRYLLFEILWEDGAILESLNSGSITGVLRNSIESNFGDYGAAVVASSLAGTIKSCQQRAIEYDREVLRRLHNEGKIP